MEKRSSSQSNRVFVQTDQGLVEFVPYRVFMRRFSSFKLTELKILQDGRFQLDNDFLIEAQLIAAIDSGQICTRVPDLARISIPDLIGFNISDVMPIVE
ncbi:hypothetical protein ETAA8_05030 [Anatilimnocola aggregata]|uniref:DUF7638 domain-containing protein n=1 Tax=Anatilimnocola aggregata TaxID=2528021 RepID=A0A517Y5C6_9BACT|nr:hypothetical protein ETAA8_05030 [Anatilimnocola aggregata]